MASLWFVIVALAIAVYAILDGFDLGAGFVSAFVARTPEERRTVQRAIGPFWDGNEVWLLAGGGVLFMAFPKLYAASFSGFYLPLMIVLWLLILRGIAIEFGSHLENPMWRSFWDVVFAGASMLLTVFFGAALGNVIRGVPLDREGVFFLPLWTHFGVEGGALGILDWYTVTVGLTAAATLAWHGALWVNYRVEGELQQRTAQFARRMFPVVLVLTVAVTAATFAIQPLASPTPLALLTLAGLLLARDLRRELRAFLGSSLYIAGMLASAAASLYPNVLPARPDPQFSLTISNAQSSAYGLEVALYWWLPALALTTGYFVFLYRRFAGKVPREGE
jgi:cytochrome d ubiquinol oxidase subunit II